MRPRARRGVEALGKRRDECAEILSRIVNEQKAPLAVDRLGDVASDSSAAGGSSSPRGWTPPAGRAASPTGAAQAAGADMIDLVPS